MHPLLRAAIAAALAASCLTPLPAQIIGVEVVDPKIAKELKKHFVDYQGKQVIACEP